MENKSRKLVMCKKINYDGDENDGQEGNADGLQERV